MDHTILSGDSFSADVRHIRSDSFSIDIGHYSFSVLVRGQFGRGKICLGLSRAGGKPTWVNGAYLEDASIHIHAENDEILYRADKSATWYALTITRERLQSVSIELTGRELDLPATGVKTVAIPLESANRVVRLLNGLSPKSIVSAEFRGVDLKEQILEAYVSAISEGEGSAIDGVRRRNQHRLELVSQADKIIRQSLGDKYSSRCLCETLGVSERALQLHFKELLGIPPKQWFACLALNRVRSEILRKGSQPRTIAELAMEVGFEHLGRFSESYRKLFRETPSQTMSKKR